MPRPLPTTPVQSSPSAWTRSPVFRRLKIPPPICRRYPASTVPGAGITSTSAMGLCPSWLPSICTTAKSSRKFRSREFILLLKELDEHYPKDCTLRVILDNHSVHISKETMAYLASRPNRFVYVQTPKHGSWLNLIETVLGKMARTFLKGVRVKSREQLKQRIRQGVSEMNLAPAVVRWKKFDPGLT